MRLRIGVVYAIGALLSACGDHPAALPAPDSEPPDRSLPQPFEEAPAGPARAAIDLRPVETAAVPPPAISGGTLLLTADERIALLSDPDRDRVSIVDLQTHTLIANVALEPGDEPGRLVADGAGRVHVALRRAGAIATLDIAQGTVLARTPVCAAPRGLAFDATQDELLVACASGELARMPAAGGEARIVARLGTDLRDVAVSGRHVLVTRFRSAEVLRVEEASGQTVASRPGVARLLFGEPSTGALRADTMSARVAYRMSAGTGESLLLSQVERDGEIELGQHPPEPERPMDTPVVSVSPYGGGGGPSGRAALGTCAGVVQPLLSLITADGTVRESRRIPGVLAVDVARSSSGVIAVAQAGALDPEHPAGKQTFAPAFTSAVLVFNMPFAPSAVTAQVPFPDAVPCAPPDEAHDVGGQVTAVAFADIRNELLAQSREPAFLAIVDRDTRAIERVMLDGASVADTGHALFHHNAGAGVACASCHAEGGDDGHTWRFSEMGLRRTQSLHVGLAGSAPFHWAGDERDFTALVSDVMVGRMGGARQTPERIAALEHWIYALQAPPAARPIADEAAQRGKLLFEGEAQCNTCHSGSALSSNETHAVGKGEALQVPSLVGVAYRKPLMHDGCAADLRARFDANCGGGDSHGKTSQLNETQLDDLVAYLETL